MDYCCKCCKFVEEPKRFLINLYLKGNSMPFKISSKFMICSDCLHELVNSGAFVKSDTSFYLGPVKKEEEI